MALLWEITYLAVLVYVVLLIPFAIFYYEADDGQGNLKESMFCQAFKYEICVLIISTLTLVLMYFFLGEWGRGGGERSEASSVKRVLFIPVMR